ncbi:MAG: hypothetical protein HJJLKODD_02885 [Phycisphaerae bacterium]|nr:hypothetical protein [Phycisphaerae bacterium]
MDHQSELPQKMEGLQTETEPAADGALHPNLKHEKSGLAASEDELQNVVDDPDADSHQSAAGMLLHEWDGELPPKLIKIQERRLQIWDRLLVIEAQRIEIAQQAKHELILQAIRRQARELQNLPDEDELNQEQSWLQEQLDQPPQLDEPTLVSKSATQTEIYHEVIQLSLKQNKLIRALRQLDPLVPIAAAAMSASEPLMEIGRQQSLAVENLLGWTYYLAGLRQIMQQAGEAQQSWSAARLAAGSRSHSSFLKNLFVTDSDEEESADEDSRIGHLIRLGRAAEREQRQLEPQLCNWYWQIYEELAWRWIGRRMAPQFHTYIRAYLRYGLVGVHPAVMPSQIVEQLLQRCSVDIYQWRNSLEAYHVLYPDELLQALAAEQITPGPDEQLELHDRGSMLWKTDRWYRQMITGRIRCELYEARLEQINQELIHLHHDWKAIQARWDTLRKIHANRTSTNPVEVEMRRVRVHLARLSRTSEKMVQKMIPELRLQVEELHDKLANIEQLLPQEFLIRREVRLLRRTARLCSRLKEYYPPLWLAQWTQLEHQQQNRSVVVQTLRDLESSDPRIFHQVLTPGENLQRQVTVRMSPVCVIVPTLGPLGMAMSPRKSNDCGRLAIPWVAAQPNQIRRMYVDMLSDFRWDTSKEEAGLDWLTSETMCAAYSSILWHYNRKPKEQRAKAGFDKKLSARQNWRTHYRLLMNSAHEGGKQLYFKCREVYDLVVKQLGLPEGIKPIKN